jgi:hypothetical protein
MIIGIALRHELLKRYVFPDGIGEAVTHVGKFP